MFIHLAAIRCSNAVNPFTVKRKETFRAKSVLKKKIF